MGKNIYMGCIHVWMGFLVFLYMHAYLNKPKEISIFVLFGA